MAKRIEVLIGENVRKLRERGGISQAELGEEVGMLLGSSWSRSTVSQAEGGKRSFVAAEVMALASVLGCQIQYLFTSSEGEAIRISDAYAFAPDFGSRLDTSGVDDEQLRRVYSKLRLTLQGLPALTAALKEDLSKVEDTARHATFLLELDEVDGPEGSEDA
jgi:transcriptional regulator with XRE-family HTH domain